MSETSPAPGLPLPEYFRLQQATPAAALPPLAGLAAAAGIGALAIEGIALLGAPQAGYLTFCDRLPAADAVDRASRAVILAPPALLAELQALFPAATPLGSDDPRALFIDLLAHLQAQGMLRPSSLLPAVGRVSPEARIAAGAIIEPGAQIDAGASVGSGAVIGAATWLKAGASIGENAVIGTVGINAYVGRDGRRRGFPHLAGVIVGAGSSIGAGTVVVRGILSSTQIGAGCIVGNLCNVGHGVEIGDDVWISVGTMIGGHSRIGSKATIAMSCAIRDNTTVGAGANLGMGSVVTKNVRPGSSVFGNPARTVPGLTSGLATGPAR